MQEESENCRELLGLIMSIRDNAKMMFDPLLEKHGLNKHEWRILVGVLENKCSTISSISMAFCLNKGNASSMCKQLEKKGLVTRARDFADERVVRLSLTQEGRERISDVLDELSAVRIIIDNEPSENMDYMLGGLRQFLSLSKRMAEFLTKSGTPDDQNGKTEEINA